MPRHRVCDTCGEEFDGLLEGMVNGVKLFSRIPEMEKPKDQPGRLEIRIDRAFDICNACLATYIEKALKLEVEDA